MPSIDLHSMILLHLNNTSVGCFSGPKRINEFLRISELANKQPTTDCQQYNSDQKKRDSDKSSDTNNDERRTYQRKDQPKHTEDTATDRLPVGRQKAQHIPFGNGPRGRRRRETLRGTR